MNNTTQTVKKYLKITAKLSIASSFLILAACGGGSGGGDNPPSTHKITIDNESSMISISSGSSSGNGASCFDHFITVLPGQSQTETLPGVKCSGILSFSDDVAHSYSLPITIDNLGVITSLGKGVKTSVDNKHLDATNGADGKTITFTPSSTSGTFIVNNQAPTTTENGSYNSTMQLSKGTCFTKDSGDIQSGSHKTLTFSSIDGQCMAYFKFDGVQCSATFTNGQIDEKTFSSGCQAFSQWSTDAKSSSKSDIIATINTPYDNKVTFSSDKLLYPLETLDYQASSWLSQIDSGSGLVQGGLTDNIYTSEGIGFELLMASGMMKIINDHGPSPLKTDYSDKFDKAFTLIQPLVGKNKGLLPWELKYEHGALTPTHEAKGKSATDGDFFIAMGEYLASKATNNKEKQILYLKASKNMMQAIYKYDKSSYNDFTFMNCGGTTNNATLHMAAYTKSMLPMMYVFSKVDTAEAWPTLIKNTLQVMKATQGAHFSNQWGNVLGFIEQNVDDHVPGAIQISGFDNDGKPTVDIPSVTLTDPRSGGSTWTGRMWQFNYDALRVPMEIGGYLLVAKNDPNSTVKGGAYALAKEVTQNEMGDLDSFFFKTVKYSVFASQAKDPAHTYGAAENGKKYYNPYADMIYGNTAASDPTTQYFDEAMAGDFFIGELGLAVSNEASNQDLRPQLTVMETKLINSGFGSSSYYDPAWKIIAGLFMDGVFEAPGIVAPDLSKEMFILPSTAPTKKSYAFLPNGYDSYGSHGAVHVGPGYLNFKDVSIGTVRFAFTIDNSSPAEWSDVSFNNWINKGTIPPISADTFACGTDGVLSNNNKTFTITCSVMKPFASINAGDFGMIDVNNSSSLTLDQITSSVVPKP